MSDDAVLPFPADAFQRVLCVVAHPDDVEYGTSSAVAAWTSQGIEVAYLLLTRGEAGMDSMRPDRTAELRVTEQVAGSHAVGVSQVEFLHHPDGVLVYSLDMRRDIARARRERTPDRGSSTRHSWSGGPTMPSCAGRPGTGRTATRRPRSPYAWTSAPARASNPHS